MFGWRRQAKAERARAISEERLFTLVNHALLRNFGPLGSYAIARRSDDDVDHLFHTMMAESIARTVTKELAESNLIVVAAPVSLAPVPVVPVKLSLAEAVDAAINPAFTPEAVDAAPEVATVLAEDVFPTRSADAEFAEAVATETAVLAEVEPEAAESLVA